MKVEWTNDDKLIIYYTLILDDILEYEIEDIKTFIKLLVIRLRKYHHLSLNGYYHLDVYINKIMILEFVQIDEYEDEIDLNIVLHLNHPIMVKYEDYFLISGKKYYYENSFYSNIDEIDITKILEFIEFIYKDDVKIVKEKGILLKN